MVGKWNHQFFIATQTINYNFYNFYNLLIIVLSYTTDEYVHNYTDSFFHYLLTHAQ